jgi:hypothetical protein
VALSAFAALVYALRFGFHSGDTLGVVAAADWVLRGLRGGGWAHGGSRFPLLQTIPTVGLRAVGLGVDQTRWSLVGLNVAAFAGLVVIAWRSLVNISRPAAIFFLAVLLSGPLAWYATSSFGEMLAALATLAMVVACRYRAGGALAAALFILAGLSKDTAFPFLLLLGFGASTFNPSWTRPEFRRRRIVGLAAAAAVTLGVIGVYNFARFGTVVNAVDSSPRLFVPELRDQVSFFLAIWLSPNGGLLLFWPSFGVLLALAGFAAFHLRGRRGELVPAGMAGLILLGLTAGFAKWWSPLGWWAWGPRLIVPWLPAVGFLLVVAYAAQLERLLAGIVRSAAWSWGLCLALAAVSLPQYVVLFRPSMFSSPFASDAVCPTTAYIERAPTYYYHCVNHQLWTKGSVLGQAYQPGLGFGSFLLGLACAAGLIWLLSLLRRAHARAPANWT